MKASTDKTFFEFNWISKYREVYFGIATLVIIYHHLTVQCNNSVLGSLYMFTRVIGALGVDAFLVLSGMGLYVSYSRDRDVKKFYQKRILRIIPTYMSNRSLSQVISADYFRWKHRPQSAVNDADAHYTGGNRRLSRAYFSTAEAGLK